MKITAITVCFNDDYKLEEWYLNYLCYKDSLFRLIIVDNGSKKEFIERVRKKFVNATIIEQEHNEGLTVAYNVGIKEALRDEDVDSIMLIGNDIKIEDESIEKMHGALFKEKNIGMVAPILLNKNSSIVADAGSTISYCFYMKPRGTGIEFDKIEKNNIYVDSVTGGMNLAKRCFYEIVGLQDEKLFMYSDEVDMGTRAKKVGFKMLVVGTACAWHQHINPPGQNKRLPYSNYLMARNKVYLGNKFYGKRRAIIIWLYILICNSIRIFLAMVTGRERQIQIYAIKGAMNGLLGNMEMPKYFRLN